MARATCIIEPIFFLSLSLFPKLPGCKPELKLVVFSSLFLIVIMPVGGASPSCFLKFFNHILESPAITIKKE